MLVPEPIEIEGTGAEAIGYDSGVVVAFSGDCNGKPGMFRRRAIRRHPDGTQEHIEMLVAEMDGVRTYLRRERDGRLCVVVSRLDLQP